MCFPIENHELGLHYLQTEIGTFTCHYYLRISALLSAPNTAKHTYNLHHSTRPTWYFYSVILGYGPIPICNYLT